MLSGIAPTAHSRRRRARPFGLALLGPEDEQGTALRVRVQSLLTAAIVVANVVGALAVTVLSIWVVPRPTGIDGDVVVANAIAIPTYVAVALAIGVTWGTRRTLRALRWLLDEEDPDERAQRRALRAPLGLLRVQAVLWGVAVVLFTTLNGILEPRSIPGVAVTVALGGLVTCATAYLLSELVLRPVAARALSARPPDRLHVPGVTARSLLAWGLGSAVPVGGLVAIGIVALADSAVSKTDLGVAVLALGGTTLLIGFLLTVLAARATVDPIRSLRGALARVEQGDLDAGVTVYDGTEVGLLQAGFNRMAEGLRERERLRDLFGRHVGRDVARAALATGVELGGEVREVGVVFVDVVGSTSIAATRAPTEVVELLNRFFAVVVDVVSAHGGSINKFEGDAALAVFGAPDPSDDAATRALGAARELARRLAAEIPDVDAGIGTSVGPAVAGNVGAEDRFEYTVIGDPVNEAARLTELAKSVPGRVLASMAAVEQASAEEAGRWREGDAVVLRGRPEPTRLAGPTD